jgi:hypothetical protein
MFRLACAAFAVAVLPFLASCDTANIQTASAGTPITVQVAHLTADAPNVNVVVNGTTILTDVPFRAATGFLPLVSGTNTIEIEAILPDGSTASAFGPTDVMIDPNTTSRVIAVGSAASLPLQPVVLSSTTTPVPAGQVRVEVVHGAPGAGVVDVFVTAPGADLGTAPSLGQFDFGGTLGPVEVAAGDYQVRVTPANTPGTVVFDSGTLPLAAGADLAIVAIPNVNAGPSPITLFVLDDTGGSELLSVDTVTDVRIFHASADAPDVDVTVDDDFDYIDATFTDVTNYVAQMPGTREFAILENFSDLGKVTPLLTANLDLVQGEQISVIASDSAANLTARVTVDDNRSIATEARVRILHLAPAAGPVTLNIVATDAGNPTDVEISNVEFGQNTGYLSLLPGSYDVSVTALGTTEPAIGPANLTVVAGGVYSIAAVEADGGGAPFSPVLYDDFAAN